MKSNDLLLLVFLVLIILDALTDVLFYKSKKFESKIIENIYKAVLMTTPMFYLGINRDLIISFLVVYICFHVLIFDTSFNLIAKADINFVGTSSGFYDKLLKKLGNWWTWVLRITIFAIGITIYICSLRNL